MSDHAHHNHHPSGTRPHALFTWRGDEVVLFAEHAGDRWVVARGWLHGDRLVDVRRWTFSSPRDLMGQVRRLAREATGNTSLAAEAAASALAWANSQAED